MAPSDGKKKPRRLLSFDSLTSPSSSSEISQPTLRQLIDDESIATDSTGSTRETWTGIDLYGPPHVSSGRSSPVPLKRKPDPLQFPRSATPDTTTGVSTSRARWDNLRQHVIPIPARAATPPAPMLPVGFTQTVPPSRSQTPVQKPSRLARLGFRHIVEHAREVDDTRKFALEFERICWSIRMAEPQKLKVDTSSAPGSSLHLAFISNTSLAAVGNSSVEMNPPTHKKHDLHRPQSMQSLTSYRAVSSIKPLYQLLLSHATPSTDKKTLPHELLVLSTLLTPFLSVERGAQVDEEGWAAIESFEIITRTWAPPDESTSVERYLWCCKAASMPPSAMRTRVLSILWGLIIPTDNNYAICTPECFQALAAGLFSLLPTLRPVSNSAAAHEEVPLLMDIIFKVRSGCCGELEAHFVQDEYNAVSSAKDDKHLIRESILLEALSRCLEDCTDDSRVWLFQNALQEYWISKRPRDTKFTPLVLAVHARTLYGLSRALLSVLSVPLDQAASLQRAQVAAQLLQDNFIPDMDALGNSVKQEARVNVVNAVLELVCLDRAREPTRWGLSLIHQWYRGSSIWKNCLNMTLQDLISKGNWSNIVFKLASLIRLLPGEIRHPLIAFALPLLYDKLAEEPPPFPYIPLTNLLDTIARLYPQIFYKPVFLCAASSKEFTIVSHLCIIAIVAKFLPDFWIRDAEMISVALMSDGGKKDSDAGGANKIWTKPRLGQAVVMLELIECVQAARHQREASSQQQQPSDPLLTETVKFVAALEARLAILLPAKERTIMLAPSQRLLFCILFREMRLLTRSLKPAPWLVRIVDWYIDVYTDDGTGPDPEEEEQSTIGQIRGLYAAAQDGAQSATQRRSTMILSKSLQKSHSLDDASLTSSDLVTLFVKKEPLITSISKGFAGKALKLLVTMSTLLTVTEYRRLGPSLWDLLQDDGDASLTAAVCFLIMQCAEKTSLDLVAIIEVDLQSSNDDTKLKAVQKIGKLFNWRYQILSQHVIADRARRPFKLARGPLAFVSTDIGSSVYIREDDPDDMQDNIPAELRKRLAEIGWDPDDAPVNQHQEWIKIPISLLSSQQVDRLENIGPDLPLPISPTTLNLGSLTSLSGDKIDEATLLRRNSSTGGPMHSLKRRAVFVPSLSLVFPRLASLVFDPNLAISSATRSTLLDIMRNDPILVSRPVLDLFAGEQKDIQSAILTINAFFHVQSVLPYPMSHFLFNNVAGFLKWATRQPEDGDALQDFASAAPVLTRLAHQVSGLSIRDIRRAKIESFLIPSGSLWFPPSAPPGPMYPRSLGSWSNPFEDVPPDLVSITTIRVSQNILLLSMLKRNHHDVQLVRKGMSRLELPTMNLSEQSPLELSDFVPYKHEKEKNSPSLTGLSQMLSRSHVLLIAQLFRSMSRHLNDRHELASLVEGLNRILLTHGDDIGIVSQIMIALMVASTRFRRLFTSGGGYALFMPAVLKVYTEHQGNSGIKLAIEYGVNRFYALHQESFVFQTLDILAHVTALPQIDAEPLVKSIYNLFFALRKGVLPSTPDAAGIHNANRLQEREALIMNTAEEKPQTFLTLLRRNKAIGESQHIVIDLPEEYEASRLGMDDFVRLFLTIIAHDPSIIRAEQFLRLLRTMAAHLYNASSRARTVLQEGIDALAILLIKTSMKLNAAEVSGGGMHSISSDTILENRLLEKSRSSSNIMTMRLDYLALVASFACAGGQLSIASMLRTMELIKTMLKEVPMDINHGISNFIPNFIQASFLREGLPHLKIVVAFLHELAPLISNYGSVVDFTSTFEAITKLAAISSFSNDPLFSRTVVSSVCGPALSSCETAAAANILLTLPSRLCIVELLSQSVLLRGADVIAEIEKQTPSYDYLAGIVLPLVLTLKTEAMLGRDGRSEPWHRELVGRAWVRLLSYAMSACRTYRTLEKSSHDRSRLNDRKCSPLPSFLIALQIIKVIVVRSDADISSRVPGIWPRLAALLMKILTDGNSLFATVNDVSPIPSPSPSPRSSIQHDDPFQSSSSANFSSMPSSRSFCRPRVIDYALWSFLELLCVHRNPLVLQMRLFVMEKLVELDNNLQQQHNDPRVRRISSSVFSKPRRRSGMHSSPGSPGSSPLLSAAQSIPYSLPHVPSLPSLEVNRQPGYNIISSPHDIPGPKIVHLGPISAISAFGRALSGKAAKGLDGMGTATKIKSMALIKATYKRIWTVQKFMGYETLLPMPESQDMDFDDVSISKTIWTLKEALDAIKKETQELLEEFEEMERTLDDDEGTPGTPRLEKSA